MSNEMSITRALVELKRTDARLDKLTKSSRFVARTIGSGSNEKVVGSNDSVEKISAAIKGNLDKIENLIDYREQLKSAIVISNAVTKVRILGKDITVAEAIELKKSITIREQLLNTLRTQRLNETMAIERGNNDLDKEIEISVNALLSSDKKDMDKTLLEVISKAKKDQKEQKLLDPSNIDSKIDDVEKKVLDVTSQLDFVLSESNAKTIINIAALAD